MAVQGNTGAKVFVKPQTWLVFHYVRRECSHCIPPASSLAFCTHVRKALLLCDDLLFNILPFHCCFRHISEASSSCVIACSRTHGVRVLLPQNASGSLVLETRIQAVIQQKIALRYTAPGKLLSGFSATRGLFPAQGCVRDRALDHRRKSFRGWFS